MRGAAAVLDAAWRGERRRDRLLRAALVPASWAYGAVVAVRNRAYDTGWLAATRVPACVIGVGNLTVGGSGKTPTALWLAERLAVRGRRVAIVARGYGKRVAGVVVVGEGDGPRVTPEEGGDEAVMLAHRFRGPILTAERRADAALAAVTRFACDTVVLDDGFQHRALARDADLVCWAADDAGATRLLPAGTLREPLAALRRARALLALGGAPPPLPPGLPSFRARLQAVGLVRPSATGWCDDDAGALAGAAVVAVAGVARPERVVATLEGLGARVVRTLAFGDHARYDAAAVGAIAAAAAAGRPVTTEKDLVKLGRHAALVDAGLCAVRLALEVDDGERLVDHLLAGGEVALRQD